MGIKSLIVNKLERSTFIIYEEFRLIDKAIVDSIMRPLGYSRRPPYLMDERYSKYQEEYRQVFISSAYLKSEWWFEETRDCISKIVQGDTSYGFIAIDWLAAVRFGIKSKKAIEEEKSRMPDITARMEYDNIPSDEAEGAYFTLSMFSKARKLNQAFYPQKPDSYDQRKNPYSIPKQDGEIRILSCDIARWAGRENDLSVTSCMRLLPTKKGYQVDIVYIESHSGMTTTDQSLRIKQVFHDFDADVIVLDTMGMGAAIYDELGLVTKDNERGIEYPALTIIKDPSIPDDMYLKYAQSTKGIKALPKIYPVIGSAQLNSMMASKMRDKLQKKMVNFLCDEMDAEEYLIKTHTKEFLNLDDINAKVWFMAPYVQTSLLINECINLSYSLLAGNVRLKEPSTGRKDRFTSLEYGLYYVSLLDDELLKQEENEDSWNNLLESYTYVS